MSVDTGQSLMMAEFGKESGKQLGALVGNVGYAPSKTIGNAINGVLLTVLRPLLEANIVMKEYFELFGNSIKTKIDMIPEENLLEPPLSIIGPALEGAKYHVDKEEMREMFARLIASSSDKTKVNNLHHSFVEIIKQLSPKDASILLEFKKDGPLNSQIPVARNVLKNFNQNIISILEEHIVYPNENSSELYETAICVQNLERLGLVNISYDSPLPSHSYSEFRSTEIYRVREFKFSNSEFADFSHDIQKGVVSLTPYGTSFIRTCF